MNEEPMNETREKINFLKCIVIILILLVLWDFMRVFVKKRLLRWISWTQLINVVGWLELDGRQKKFI